MELREETFLQEDFEDGGDDVAEVDVEKDKEKKEDGVEEDADEDEVDGLDGL